MAVPCGQRRGAQLRLSCAVERPIPEQDAEVVVAPKASGLENLKGHHVGSLQALIFNVMPKEGVEALVNFLDKYEKAHK